MSPFQFRAILVGYLALAASNMLLGYLPPRQAAFSDDRTIEHLRSKPKFFRYALVACLLAAAASGIVGFVGMFFFWPLAPKLFVVATVGKILIGPVFCRGLSSPTRNEWQQVCSYSETLLDGVIAAATLIGSARPLFGVL